MRVVNGLDGERGSLERLQIFSVDWCGNVLLISVGIHLQNLHYIIHLRVCISLFINFTLINKNNISLENFYISSIISNKLLRKLFTSLHTRFKNWYSQWYTRNSHLESFRKKVVWRL